jgi:hypothetical protein
MNIYKSGLGFFFVPTANISSMKVSLLYYKKLDRVKVIGLKFIASELLLIVARMPSYGNPEAKFFQMRMRIKKI